MARPPDQLGFTIDKNLTLKLPGKGPKYLIISRNFDLGTNQETLSSVSPFLIKKVIDNVCCGEVSTCKKIRNGNLLVITKNYEQASKLIQLTSLAPSIRVNVTEHTSLNSSKGVIYSNALRGIEEKEILDELLTQNVSEVKKIRKLINGTLSETGLIVLTFSTLTLPSDILIGYEKINTRPFIPLPLKCRNCQRFGHSFKFCNNPALCTNCSNAAHLNSTENETCTLQQTCINCYEANYDSTAHSPLDKRCPIFLKEKEIQMISTLEKKDKKEAARIYHSRHQLLDNNPFSSVVQTGNLRNPINYADLNNEPNTNNKNAKMITRSETAKLTAIDKKLAHSSSLAPPKTNTDNNIFILPRNANKKSKLELKRLSKKKLTDTLKPKSSNPNVPCMEASDSSTTDMDTFPI